MKPKVLMRSDGPGQHQWRVCLNVCDISDVADATVAHIVQAIRDAYGEKEILEEIESDPEVAATFNVGAVLKCFRSSLPDPTKEGDKPATLRTTRSEAAEFFARETLRMVCNIETPPTLHACKGNAMQPMLGYDGWGMVQSESGVISLALIQVKGSDELKSPPGVATELVKECATISVDDNKLARALAACLMRVKGTQIGKSLIRMLEQLGNGTLPSIVVAPVIVRGEVHAKEEDLTPIRNAVDSFGPIVAMGVVVSIGAPLNEFGALVMARAREA